MKERHDKMVIWGESRKKKTSIITVNLSGCNQSQFLLVPLLDGAGWKSTSLSLKTVLEKLLTSKLSSSLFPTTVISVEMNLSESCSWKNVSVHCWHGWYFSFEIKCFLYKDNVKAVRIEIKKKKRKEFIFYCPLGLSFKDRW